MRAGIFSYVLEISRCSQTSYFFSIKNATGNLVSPEVYARLGDAFPLMKGIKNTFNDLPLALKYKDAVPSSQVHMSSFKIQSFHLNEKLVLGSKDVFDMSHGFLSNIHLPFCSNSRRHTLQPGLH